MKGLLRKDLLIAGGTGRLLLGAALVLNVLPVLFGDAGGALSTLGNTYALLMAFLAPVTCISVDERCKWDRLAAMLPCRAEQLVGSKYMTGWAYALLGGVVVLAGAGARELAAPGAADWRGALGVILMLLFSAVLLTAVGIPLTYLFGSEKARFFMIVLLAAGVGIGMTVMNLIFSYGKQEIPLISPAIWILLGTALSAFLTYVSYRLSVKFYLRRRDGRYEP